MRQKIPVELQGRKPLTVEISSLSGNGGNDIGILCSPETWNSLTNGSGSLVVRLMSSNRAHTEIGGIDLRSEATGFLGYIPNVHYLFWIMGETHAKATVEITFPNGPEKSTSADIIVGKTPIDTKL